MKLSRLVNPDRKKHTLAAICESVDHSLRRVPSSDSGCSDGRAGVLPAAGGDDQPVAKRPSLPHRQLDCVAARRLKAT